MQLGLSSNTIAHHTTSCYCDDCFKKGQLRLVCPGWRVEEIKLKEGVAHIATGLEIAEIQTTAGEPDTQQIQGGEEEPHADEIQGREEEPHADEIQCGEEEPHAEEIQDTEEEPNGAADLVEYDWVAASYEGLWSGSLVSGSGHGA